MTSLRERRHWHVGECNGMASVISVAVGLLMFCAVPHSALGDSGRDCSVLAGVSREQIEIVLLRNSATRLQSMSRVVTASRDDCNIVGRQEVLMILLPAMMRCFIRDISCER